MDWPVNELSEMLRRHQSPTPSKPHSTPTATPAAAMPVLRDLENTMTKPSYDSVRPIDVPQEATDRLADKALVEIEQANGRFRIALRYSETDADFLWLSREQAGAVASELCALLAWLRERPAAIKAGHPAEAVAAAIAAAQYCNVNWDQQIDGAASVALAVLDAAAPYLGRA